MKFEKFVNLILKWNVWPELFFGENVVELGGTPHTVCVVTQLNINQVTEYLNHAELNHH